jgi:hypothetical protein
VVTRLREPITRELATRTGFRDPDREIGTNVNFKSLMEQKAATEIKYNETVQIGVCNAIRKSENNIMGKK